MAAELIAPRAAEWLERAEAPRIHSLYHNSVNLIDEREGLLSLVTPPLGPGPFAIVANSDNPSFHQEGGFRELEPNARVRLRTSRITLGQLRVDLAEVKEWDPHPDWRRFGSELTEERIAQLRTLLDEYSPSGSFAPLIALADDSAFELQSPSRDRWIRAAEQPARALGEAIATEDQEMLRGAVRGLAGLGGGVTPSGDDYLQGVIHALWTFELANSTAATIAESAVPHTNSISRAWLQAAARGEAGNDWHALTQAALRHRELEPAAARLIQRGHTSGADALTGFLVAVSNLS